MSRNSYNYFKNRQHLASRKAIATREFNTLFTEMMSSVYDSFVNFSFDLYGELENLDTLDNSIFSSIYENIKEDIENQAYVDMLTYLRSDEFPNDTNMDAPSIILAVVFNTYFNSLIQEYSKISSNYLSIILKEKSDDLSSTDCFIELVHLDRNFISASSHRLKRLLEMSYDTCMYLNDMFFDEYFYSISNYIKDDILNIVYDTISFLFDGLTEEDLDELFEELGSKDDEEVIEEGDKVKLDYIDDYKRLNKLAIDNGFEYIRSKGDHGIYKNKNGLVVIPQGRSIGKGLSIKIQKSILSLANFK